MMYTYIIRRLLLMIPTFVGITMIAFFVMNVAGAENAATQEINILRGQGGGGEFSESGSMGEGRGAFGGLSLAQEDRIRRRYELHRPVILHFSVKDRSDIILGSMALLDQAIPELTTQRVLAEAARYPELKSLLDHYLQESKNLDLPWYHENVFVTKFSNRLAELDLENTTLGSLWDSFQDALDERTTFRKDRERAQRDLEKLADRINVVLAENWSQLTAAEKKRGIKYSALYSNHRFADETELVTWWSENQAEYSAETLRGDIEALLRMDPDGFEASQAQEKIIRGPKKSFYVPLLFGVLDDRLSLEKQVLLISLFEGTSGCDAIPYIEKLTAEAVEESRHAAATWYRDNYLEFEEVGLARGFWNVFSESRYGRWFLDILKLDFRESRSLGIPVLQAIADRLPISLQFGLIGFILGYSVCIPLGIYKALGHGGRFDLVSSVVVFIGYSIPNWAAGFILLYLFSGGIPGWDFFPLTGFVSENYDQMTFFEKFKDRVWHGFLPVVAYSVGAFATTTLLMKNSLLENLGADYVRTAFAKGLREKRVIFIHALRNSLIPLCVGLGHMLSLILAGSYLVEKVFTINGFGMMGFNALVNFDINLIMGVLVIGSILRLFGNLFSDILYSLVDPRIRFK